MSRRMHVCGLLATTLMVSACGERSDDGAGFGSSPREDAMPHDRGPSDAGGVRQGEAGDAGESPAEGGPGDAGKRGDASMRPPGADAGNRNGASPDASTPPPEPRPTFRNPLNQSHGSDPWLVYHEGYYYLTTTTWSSELTIARAETLAGLESARPQVIYADDPDPSRCCNFWAPEMHLLESGNGKRWYYYYSGGIAENTDHQRMHVLESAGTDPMGPYAYKARLAPPNADTWSIDHSVLQLDGELYLLYSAWSGPNQNLYIAPMSNPWTLSGPRVLISTPTHAWERQVANVNEAPVALQHDGDTFIVYSASACWSAEYKLGLLRYTGGSPLRQAAWQKLPDPVFQASPRAGVYGPAHNGFFMSPDGTEHWLVYHANDAPSDGCDTGRTTRAQPFTWNADGTPDFGEPLPLDADIPVPSGE